MDVEQRNREALAAVVRLARRLGLPSDDPEVLSARGNLLVHLRPAPVLARAATLTARTRRDPAAWLAREVAVAGHAARRGGPVAAPTSLADPGPHLVDGLPVVLLEYRETVAGRASGRELGRALGAFHVAADGLAGLPWLPAATGQVSEALDACEQAGWLPAEVLAVLRAEHAAALAGLEGSAPLVVHGDAHAGNLLRGPDGWFWVDLEEAGRGPPEWDLATAAAGDPEVLAGWAEVTGRPVPDLDALSPFARAREIEAVAWLAAMAHLHPARYAELARTRLAALLDRRATAPTSRPRIVPGGRSE